MNRTNIFIKLKELSKKRNRNEKKYYTNPWFLFNNYNIKKQNSIMLVDWIKFFLLNSLSIEYSQRKQLVWMNTSFANVNYVGWIAQLSYNVYVHLYTYNVTMAATMELLIPLITSPRRRQRSEKGYYSYSHTEDKWTCIFLFMSLLRNAHVSSHTLVKESQARERSKKLINAYMHP